MTSQIRQIQKLLAGLFLLSALLLSGCATNPVTGKSDLVLMSEQQEIDLGQQSHQQLLQAYPVYDDSELQTYVNNLGQKLALASHRSHLDYTFTVLDSPDVNAFAAPGGFIYITRGIMAYMNSEEELAGVLGHEIGHVTARHAVRRQTAQAGAGLFSVVVAMATGSADAGRAASQAAGAFTSGYGRSHELEADRLGAEYLARTGYDPQKMLDVVGILKDQEEFEKQRAREENRAPRNYHGVFASHPKNDTRLQEVIKAADRFKVEGVSRTDPEKFLRLMDGVVFGHSEDQGILRGHDFYHKKLDFRLSLPDQWRVDNQPNQLVAIRPDNKAAILIQLDQRGDHDNAGQYLKNSFPNISQLKKLNRNSYSGITSGQTPFGNGPIRVAARIHGDHVFVFSGIAQSQLPDQQVYDTIKSFRKLNKSELKLATAKHLKLVRVKSGDSFASLAKKLKLGRYGEEQLRLINGLYPDGEPEPGKLIKIIR